MAWEAAGLRGEGGILSADGFAALSSSGLSLKDDGGNLGIFVKDGGNVGIGTSSPGSELEVKAAGSPEIMIRTTTESVGQLGVLRYTTGTGIASASNILSTIISTITQADPSTLKGDLSFRTNQGDSVVEAMYISDAGNVGIGTSAPNSLLELGFTTENLEFVDAGSTSATEQDWIQVEVGGNVGYIRVYATK
jgi:hypothetical protein